MAQNTRHKVIIVGAGLSGYSAAAKLLENELDEILILEAENRKGGRIDSVPFAGGIVDMGKLKNIFLEKNTNGKM